MSHVKENSLIVKKETAYDKIRKGLFFLIYQKDYEMIKQLEVLLKPKRLPPNTKIIIPKEIKKLKLKYDKY